jgi:hypothetical protein
MNEEQTYATNPNTQDTQWPCETPAQCSDLVAFARQYAREKPGVVALWCLGVGFVLGWKLKPW